MNYPLTWKNVTIGESLHLINGRAFKSTEWTTSGTPIIRIQNLNSSRAAFNFYKGDLPEKFRVEPGDLLFAWSGTPGTSFGAHVWKGPAAWLNQHIFKVAFPTAAFDRTFLRLAINQNLAKYINVAHGGAGLAHITKGKFEASVLPLPPLSEQHRIVAKIEELFSELDAGEENLRRARRQLGVYRQSLLKQAFEGKLNAQRRDHETNVGLSTGEDRLPLSWISIPAAKIGRIETGTTPPTANPLNYGGEFPFFKPTDLEQGRNVKVAREFLSQAGRKYVRELPAGSVLVTCIGATIGKTGMAKIPCATNQQINSISPSKDFLPEFIYFQAIGPRFQDQIKTNASSTTLPILNKSKFSALRFSIPSLPEQQEIVRILEEQFEIISQNEKEIDAALKRSEALRQSILKKAFNGQLVAQNPADEPASVLLERIRAERATAVPAKKIPKKAARKTSPRIGDDLVPAMIPALQSATKPNSPPGKTDLQAGIVALAILAHENGPEHFGHVKAEKIVHLCDVVARLQLGREPVKDAAGPNDFPRAKKVEHRAAMQGWFTVTKKRGAKAYTYQRGRNFERLVKDTEVRLGPQLKTLRDLIDDLASMSWREAELVATVHAAWNNLLLLKQTPSEEEIVTEARENWHPDKMQIGRPEFFEAIAWIEQACIQPTGTGQAVFQKKK